MSSYFTLLHSRSTNTLSNARPRPSMLTATPPPSRRPVKAAAVNCTPWSVLKTSGFPNLKASSSSSRPNDPSSVFDSLQATTHRLTPPLPAPPQAPPCRLDQSVTAARYMNPAVIGTYVISVLQTWSARSTVTPRSRYG